MADFEFDVGISVEEIRGDFEVVDESVRQLGAVVESVANAFLNLDQEAQSLGVSMQTLAGISKDTEETYRNFLQTMQGSDHLTGATLTTFEGLVAGLDEIGKSAANTSHLLDVFFDKESEFPSLGVDETGKQKKGAGIEDAETSITGAVTRSVIRTLTLGTGIGIEFFGGPFADDPGSAFGKAAKRPTRQQLEDEQNLNDANELRFRQAAFDVRRQIDLRGEQEKFAVLQREAERRETFERRAESDRTLFEKQQQAGFVDISAGPVTRAIQNAIASRRFDARQEQKQEEANAAQIRSEEILERIANAVEAQLDSAKDAEGEGLEILRSAR